MIKTLENKESAINELEILKQNRIDTCNIILKFLIDMHETIPRIKQKDVSKDKLSSYIVENFIACFDEIEHAKELKINIDKLNNDIQNGLCDHIDIINKYRIDIKNNSRNGTLHTFFMDKNRYWYYAQLIRYPEASVKSYTKYKCKVEIFTLHDKYLNEKDINKKIVIDDNITCIGAYSDPNVLLNTIINFLDGKFNTNSDNAYK